MSKTIIEITGLGKKYPIIHNKTYATLRENLAEFTRHPLTKTFAKKRDREIFWALKNVNLTVNRGDIIGIIGKNGAGKSTLLKILSGITKPTEGRVRLWGRVSSLLEVGTGFHPELTGRENIFLNGVILGMSRAEVAKKFDEIVAFAGIEKFLDTPVKRYSSGMYVRLAFAVAAHLEPDILIVDEVLAVGDAEFQKKCLGKMEEVSKKQERTVILVTHDLNAMLSICTYSLLLNQGTVEQAGIPHEIVQKYINSTDHDILNDDYIGRKQDTEYASIRKLFIENSDNEKSNIIISDSEMKIGVSFEIHRYLRSALVSFIFYADNKIIYVASDQDATTTLRDYPPGSYKTEMTMPPNMLNPGLYDMEVIIQKPDAIGATHYARIPKIPIQIMNSGNNKTALYGGRVYGYFGINVKIQTVSL